MESEESHHYSSSRYSLRLQSPLTNCSCSHHRCRRRSELLNVQQALIFYSNRTWRQQFSHRYALQFRRRHTGLTSQNSPYSYFSTFPPINQPIGFGGHTTIFRNGNPQSTIESSEAPMIPSTSPPASSGLSAPSTAIMHSLHPGQAQAMVHWSASQAHYEAPYEMLHGFGKPMYDAAGNEISYQDSLHNLCRFGCYASRLIPEDQRHQEDKEYIEEIDTGDEPLRGQDSQPTQSENSLAERI